MKAAILHGPRELRVEAARAPEPGADQALVRVAVAGLCGTDYSIFSGDRPVTYPRVMGHEFVGRVETGTPPRRPATPGPTASDRESTPLHPTHPRLSSALLLLKKKDHPRRPFRSVSTS